MFERNGRADPFCRALLGAVISRWITHRACLQKGVKAFFMQVLTMRLATLSVLLLAATMSASAARLLKAADKGEVL